MDNKPQFIITFIELYRSFPCLWKVKDDCYHNRRLKEDAYDKLLEYYQTAVPAATVDMVKRKINNLRSAFRKELKKVKKQKSGSSGDDNYTSSLWYFELLMFTADQEMRRNSTASDKFIVIENESDQNETFYEDDIIMFTPSISHSSPLSPLSSHSPLPSQSPLPSHSPQPSVPSKITNKRKSTIINEAYKALKEDDEYDGIGLNVACKLRRMNDEQRLHAELLINKVMLYGLKQRLQEETIISGLVPIQSQIRLLQHQPNISPNLSQSILQLAPVKIETSDTVVIDTKDLNIRDDDDQSQ